MTRRRAQAIAWWWVFPIAVGVSLCAILIPLFLPHPTAADRTADAGFYVTTHGLLWGGIAPMSVFLALTAASITVLGLWGRVWRDSVPTRRWVKALPIVLVVPCLAFTRYDALSANGATFGALVVLLVLLTGAAEELMYRGLVVEMLRGGLAEVWTAVVSTLMFGLAHLINGGGAIPTVISALIGGYLYYLCRRSGVLLAVPILAHAAFDLFGYSQWNASSDAGFNMFVYQTALFVVALALSRFISPAPVHAGSRIEQPVVDGGPSGHQGERDGSGRVDD